MCVIVYLDNEAARPSESVIERMWNQNPDGGGYAHRTEIEGVKYVVWGKNISLAEMKVLAKTMPLPGVLHFRRASSGGKLPELCHPFEISRTTSLDLAGVTTNPVLFHNGDWHSDWKSEVLRCSAAFACPLPDGRAWSDTRAMAFLSSLFSPKAYMDFIGHKGIYFGPNGDDDYEIFDGKDGWKEIDGMLCSNDYFVNRGKGSTSAETQMTKTTGDTSGGTVSKFCLLHSCHERQAPGSVYCKAHQPTSNVSNFSQATKMLGPGGSQQADPFPEQVNPRLIHSMEEANRYLAEKRLSKNKWRQVRHRLTGM